MRFFSFYCLLILLSSCVKDTPIVNSQTAVLSSNGVYIVGEGNFNFGNSTISYYNIGDQKVQEDVYRSANNSALGDVAQSMVLFNGKAYVVINNSGAIKVLDTATAKELKHIDGFTSPRCFLPLGNGKAYVSDLYANAISVVDLNSSSIVGTIACAGWTEEMALCAGKVFVCNLKKTQLYIVDISTDKLVDSIAIGCGASSLQEDKNGKLWVLSSGDKNVAAQLQRINPLTEVVEAVFVFESGSPQHLKTNGSRDSLYYLNNGVYAIAVSADALPKTPMISAGNSIFYGLGIDPQSGDIYVSDAMDYVQKSTIYRYNSKGNLRHSFKSGINSNSFCFKQ